MSCWCSIISFYLNAFQLCFALSSSSVFSRTDTSTDLEQFYESVLDFLDHPDEKNDVHDLFFLMELFQMQQLAKLSPNVWAGVQELHLQGE